jgi:hypothetical protein
MINSPEPRIRPAQGHVNALELRILIKAVAAEFAPETALLVAADRQLWRTVDDAVDPAAPGANAPDALKRVFEIG